MHVGYQVSNILESAGSHNNSCTEALYLCHNSIFDLMLVECGVDPHNYDPNNKKFLNNNSRIYSWHSNDLIKPYSIHLINNPLEYLKNNNSIHFHLNTVAFSHDIGLLSIKKEDAYLLCTNAFRPHDTLVYFNSIMSNYNCPKINRIKLDYSIPDSIKDLKSDRSGIALFCYNKSLGSDLVNSISADADQIISLSNSVEELNDILNKYEIFIELDPGSIINALAAVAGGAISIILDPNNILIEYKNIPNLYMVNSLPELSQLLSQKPRYNPETTVFNSKFRNFDGFKEKITDIIKTSQRKAFVL